MSAGFTYRYRARRRPDQRVDADSIQIGGRRIGPGDRVRVAASDFLLNGGDGFTVFGESTERLASGADIQALVDYFTARSPVLAAAAGPHRSHRLSGIYFTRDAHNRAYRDRSEEARGASPISRTSCSSRGSEQNSSIHGSTPSHACSRHVSSTPFRSHSYALSLFFRLTYTVAIS